MQCNTFVNRLCNLIQIMKYNILVYKVLSNTLVSIYYVMQYLSVKFV